MKVAFTLAILACSLAVISAACVNSQTNGQPICDAANTATGKFRNNWDPTEYWLCATANNQPATAVSCEGEGYVSKDVNCVPWSDWLWAEPCDPPNMFIA